MFLEYVTMEIFVHACFIYAGKKNHSFFPASFTCAPTSPLLPLLPGGPIAPGWPMFPSLPGGPTTPGGPCVDIRKTFSQDDRKRNYV